jgi:uncharacterized protein (DUF302 family)
MTDFNVAGLQGRYGYSRVVPLPFDQALRQTREALKAEGFGVLCEIDIRSKLKEKLGVEFRNYMILGACHPPSAYETLQLEIDLGLLLPCNVIVYEKEGSTVVSAIDAEKMLSIVGNPGLTAAASRINQKLKAVVDAL